MAIPPQNTSSRKISPRTEKIALQRVNSLQKYHVLSRKNTTPEEFEAGIIKDKKMLTIHTTTEMDKIGSFQEETRNLTRQRDNHEYLQQEFKSNTIFVDADIDDITYFQDEIISITEKETFK